MGKGPPPHPTLPTFLLAMRITRLSVYEYRLRLEEPLRLKGGVLSHREGLLLRLETADGRKGWGEAAPLPGRVGGSGYGRGQETPSC